MFKMQAEDRNLNETTADAPRASVLIADDDPMILLGLEEMLHELGIANVLRAGTGAKALAKLEELGRMIRPHVESEVTSKA